MSNQVKTVGEAREIWNRNGLAWGSGVPDYLFENAEALLKLEGKIAEARAALELALPVLDENSIPIDEIDSDLPESAIATLKRNRIAHDAVRKVLGDDKP